MAKITKTIQLGEQTLVLETGEIARQADGAIFASMNGTQVLVTVVGKRDGAEKNSFFPLTVDYQEKTYAAGKIPGGFKKREGAPSEHETLTSRLIDRPLRPLFPDDFYNEVQRIKNTVLKINDGKKNCVLIDELFKGTNILDAMKCSTQVIEGLQKLKSSIFILSTHLYEISDGLTKHNNIQFSYFETSVKDKQLHFQYHLTPGISQDRIGYLILEREGVVDLLNAL